MLAFSQFLYGCWVAGFNPNGRMKPPTQLSVGLGCGKHHKLLMNMGLKCFKRFDLPQYSSLPHVGLLTRQYNSTHESKWWYPIYTWAVICLKHLIAHSVVSKTTKNTTLIGVSLGYLQFMVDMYIYIHTYMYIYIHIYIYVHIYIYIYM
jgi:hypothetical protein